MMSQDSVVVAVSGMPGSGKGSFIKLFQDLGARVFQMGDRIRQEVSERKLEPTPENVGKVASEMRTLHGPDIWARRIVELVRQFMEVKGGAGAPTPSPGAAQIIIIDGVRSMKEVDFFRNELPGFFLVSIHTAPEIRWRRMAKRGRSDDFPDAEKFRERDLRELNWGIAVVIALSDEIIMNNQGPEELGRKGQEFLNRLLASRTQERNS